MTIKHSPPSPVPAGGQVLIVPTPLTLPRPPARVLLIRPSALGDVCRSVPLLVSLRSAWPDAQIDWLVNANFADAVRAHPALSAVVPFDRQALGHWWTPTGIGHLRALIATLRRPRYDLVIDAQGLARSAALARITSAAIRIGPADAREGGRFAYTCAVPISQPHTVDAMLQLLGPLHIPAILDLGLYVPAESHAKLNADEALRGRRFAVIAPTSRWPGKRWPADRFATLARQLLRLRPARLDAVVVVGSASERAQCEPILALAKAQPADPELAVIDRVGATSVGDLMALISRAALVVANDSAAIHIATGFGRPMIALYGPTDTAKVGPYRATQCVIQHRQLADILNHKNQAAGLAMMRRITVDEVLEKSAAALAPAL